jgi:enoyl-CoA hydratase
VIRVESLSDDRLLLVSLERPEKRNALTRPIIERLRRELDRVRDDSAVRGVVLAGAGPSFCTGVDLHEFAEASPESARALIVELKALCATLRLFPKPVACAIQGHCLGGALELAACCDFRVSTPDALLGMPEVTIGLPSVIDAVMLGHLVGTGRAHELLLTGEPIRGQTAFDWGLVNRLAAPADLVTVASELVGRVTHHQPEVIAAQKRLHQAWLDLPYDQAVERSVEPVVEAFRQGWPQRIASERLRHGRGPQGEVDG